MSSLRSKVKYYDKLVITPESSASKRGAKVYYAALKRATPKWANWREINKIFARKRKLNRLGKNVAVDHIVPLKSPYVCGLNVHYNLQILTYEENAKKGNLWWPDMWNYQDDLELEDTRTYQLRMSI